MGSEGTVLVEEAVTEAAQCRFLVDYAAAPATAFASRWEAFSASEFFVVF